MQGLSSLVEVNLTLLGSFTAALDDFLTPYELHNSDLLQEYKDSHFQVSVFVFALAYMLQCRCLPVRSNHTKGVNNPELE